MGFTYLYFIPSASKVGGNDNENFHAPGAEPVGYFMMTKIQPYPSCQEHSTLARRADRNPPPGLLSRHLLATLLAPLPIKQTIIKKKQHLYIN